MSVEQELKLHVLKESRHAVETLVNSPKAETIHLRAFYYDTHDRELARAGIALRLRKEPEGWVQTIKLPGEDALSKIELNHLRPEAKLDLSVYNGTLAESAFKQLKSALMTRFETDIYRTLRTQSTAHGLIELAYDTGMVRSGALELPVCELELELKEGTSTAIFELAETWQQQHHFILDFRSKAERGDALADQAIALKAGGITTEEVDLNAVFKHLKLWQPCQDDVGAINFLNDPTHQLKKYSQQYLEQIARNAVIIAGIERTDMPGNIHLDLSAHIYHLCHALQKMNLLWSAFQEKETVDTSMTEMLQALKTYHREFLQLSLASPCPNTNYEQKLERSAHNPYAGLEPAAAQQRATELATSIDFQHHLLKVLAWTILN